MKKQRERAEASPASSGQEEISRRKPGERGVSEAELLLPSACSPPDKPPVGWDPGAWRQEGTASGGQDFPTVARTGVARDSVRVFASWGSLEPDTHALVPLAGPQRAVPTPGHAETSFCSVPSPPTWPSPSEGSNLAQEPASSVFAWIRPQGPAWPRRSQCYS